MNAEKIQTIAVLGLGTMGHGIAQAFATAGLAVRAFDEDRRAREQAVIRIENNLRHLAAAGMIAADEIQPILARIQVVETEAEAVADAQFVTEAVREDLQTKQRLFVRIEQITGANTIVASNTSSYPMSEIARDMARPQRAINTHWFNPPHIIPVVEIVPGQRTDPQVTQTAYDLLARIGKTPVRLKQEVPGFLVNRVQVALFREIWDLWERGVADAEEIDRAIRGSMGLRLAALGPLAIIDFAGLDITTRVYENLAPHLRSDSELHDKVKTLVAEGNFGVKTGRGFFSYTPESVLQKQAERDRLYLALVALLHSSSPQRQK
ncbi:MAG: 3-hydroxybutyryl-CoA dehydrogenase [Gemmatales bacterium]|nr:MAG: 3-hydroxybutyryl-CoA dehydrogenase [Gemmatales bacterium]